MYDEPAVMYDAASSAASAADVEQPDSGVTASQSHNAPSRAQRKQHRKRRDRDAVVVVGSFGDAFEPASQITYGDEC